MSKTYARAHLLLENGIIFEGYSFGSGRSRAGEVVFNTAMTGYPESLTDPSYYGQILVPTYPLIGNYGVPGFDKEHMMLKHYESDRIAVSGLVISDYTAEYSHWNAQHSLGEWLQAQDVPGIFGIDTRRLTKILREHGTMLGKLIIGNEDIQWYDPGKENIVTRVSPSGITEYGNGKHRIVLADFGVKNNIIRCLLDRNTTVIRVPWDYDYSSLEYDGLFLSNGPGDPAACDTAIRILGKAFSNEKPIFGICLGSQLMALAAGASTYKLKYGHRSHNQPVIQVGTPRCFVTSQNHGYAVDASTLPDGWQTLFLNLNDRTCEGIRHETMPFFSTQFHPEASSGPTDTEYLFDEFIQMVSNHKEQ
jgi:carbamoyl-phosphate synthase small subunit